MTSFTMSSLMTLLMTCQSAWGHGMMLDPVQRSSMWRNAELFPDSPRNDNDNELFCGGFAKQWEANGGRCGVCGDDFRQPQPRQNEAGGKYATGVIVKTYQRGDVITATVRITANHKGFFTFKLCPNNDVTKIVTQECLDRHVLTVVGPQGPLGDKFYDDDSMGDKYVTLLLPTDVTCTHCVLQWTWRAGNMWGCNYENKEDCCTGCGRQETYVNCADIAIVDGANNQTTAAPGVTASPVTTTTTTTTTTEPAAVKTTATTNCTCKAAGAYVNVANMTTWCCQNCPKNCPESHCSCS